eukprot:88697_1
MISLNKHSIDATVENRYASVIYSFAFKNPNQSGSSELKFEITIDTAAFISKFVANIDGILFIGHTKEKETAKKEYIAAKHKDENAILVSQPYDDIPNVFRIKTNIDSKSKIILKITIEQYLQKRFNFNELTIQILRNFERYNIRKKYAHIAFRLNVKDQSGIYDVSIPHASHGSITINERVTDTPNAFMMSGTIDAQHSWMNELVLKYKVKGEANDSVLLYDDTTHTFCHILSDIVTDCAINDEKDIFEGYGDDIKENVLIPRRVVFVIDRSGSMSGHKWNKTIAATVCALKRLRHGYDRYCIIHFDSAIESYPTSGLLLANADNIDQTITHLKLIQPRGSTDINSALLSGIDRITADIVQLNQTTRRNKDNFFMNQLIMITDGEPNSGVSDTHQIISNVSRANSLQSIDAYSSKICIFCFGIGADGNDSSWIKDLNHSFLRVLAANNNGFYKRIKQTKTDTLLNELFDVLSKPILTHIDIQYNDKYVNDLTQTRFDSLYAGNDIIICGRISADHITSLNVKAFALTGKEITAGKGNVICSKPTKICKVMKVHTDECSALDSSNVERIWAYLKLQQYAEKKLIINDMIEYDADERKTDDVLPLELALKYKFVTPWTSMVLVKKKDAKKMQNVQLCDEDDDEDEDSEEESSEESEEDRKNKKKKGKKGKIQTKRSVRACSSRNVSNNQQNFAYHASFDMSHDLFGSASSQSHGSSSTMDPFAALAGASNNYNNPFRQNSTNTSDDLLGDLFGGMSTGVPSNSNPFYESNVNDNPFRNDGYQQANILGKYVQKKKQVKLQPFVLPVPQPLIAYDKNGIKIVFRFIRCNEENKCRICAEFTNHNSVQVCDFAFKVAVPKYIKLQIKPADGTVLKPFARNKVKQSFQLLNAKYGQKSFVIKIQIMYKTNGIQHKDVLQVDLPQ